MVIPFIDLTNTVCRKMIKNALRISFEFLHEIKTNLLFRKFFYVSSLAVIKYVLYYCSFCCLPIFPYNIHMFIFIIVKYKLYNSFFLLSSNPEIYLQLHNYQVCVIVQSSPIINLDLLKSKCCTTVFFCCLPTFS